MPALVRGLASLKLSVVLLVLVAAVLSAGTILESLHGAEAARAVYYAGWFYALQGLFALNVVAALWQRFPRDRQRIGFLVTHAAMLLIMAGALMTATMSLEGRLPLWEGESSTSFTRVRHGLPDTRFVLPFAVRLDAYEMDYYPGTMRPAQFRSRVTVLEPTGAERQAVIEMNRPLTHGGYSFFQSSYQLEDGRERTILAVSRDPGQPVVFWGYYLLVLGMLVVLMTRVVQNREAARPRPAAGLRIAASALPLAIGLVALAGRPALAQHDHGAMPHAHGPARLAPASMVEALRRLPVQHDGREMPFDTQAREAVRSVTGQRRWAGQDPVATVMGWTLDSHGWLEEPCVRVDAHVAELLGRPAGTRHVSFAELLGSRRLRAVFAPALERAEADEPQQPGDKSLLALEDRLRTFDEYLTGQGIRAVPAAERAQRWEAPEQPADPGTWTALEARLRPGAPAHYPGAAKIAAELLYNRVDSTRVAWWLLLPAAIAAGLTLERDRWRLRAAGIALLLGGFAVMTWGIAMRWQVAGRIPASNMYESMLFLGWGVGLFGVIAASFRSRIAGFNAAAMSALTMLLLDRLPMDPFVHPMAPVLSGTPWLAIHVPIIMVSYSTFAIATFLAHVQIGAELFGRGRDAGRGGSGQRWSRLLYWYLMVGSIFLAAGILTGSIWASTSWGRYWGWDPKEVWSLVAFLAYMAILHARSDGLIGGFGVALASIVAFWTILMTYLGVNFVLASGLHSYGFGSTNLVRVMALVAGAEAVFLLAAALRRRTAAA